MVCDLQDKWYSELIELMQSVSPDGPVDTVQFMRCACIYGCAGTAYGFGAGQGPQVLYDILNYFQRKFQLTSDQIPDCWVINSYNTADKFIDWHTDDDHLFGALDGPAEILAISLGADGVFNVSPNAESSA